MSPLSFSIWSVIILFGAAQGLFLAVYLFTKRENRKANKWLALLLAAISLHLLEYGADLSGVTLHFPFLVASTYPLLFCMGPFYFLYCNRLTGRQSKTGLKTVLHFIPAVLVLLLMLPFYTMPEQEKLRYLMELGAENNLNIPVEQLIFMTVHVTQTAIYVYAAYRLIVKKEKALLTVSSDALAVKKIGWLHRFSLYFAVYLALYLLLVVVLAVVDSYQVQIDYVMLLLTAASIYAIGYSAIKSPDIFKAFPESAIKTPSAGPKNGNRFPELKQQLLQLMESDKPYLKNDLKISELAEALSIPYHQLSQLINDEFRVNFYDFINSYRVEEAKKRLREDNRNAKMLAIAFETGFNSKATFNRVFKKFTGLSPSEFREKHPRPI